MLELKDISKNYIIGNNVTTALKNINIKFRKSEFVSILGPSGCGKTTLLNIIGGLDHYTKGDLVINGKSTKKFNDSDWDTYRNNKIGFIFQSYNLIPHQTVLSNVELALTLSGVSRQERINRAIDILTKVGLKDHMYKKPNQMSGGQMQRVAIARALINNPDIILADEPTGALDSETSIQIMEILKNIAKDKLVIMVTHNPELAKNYSTRIIKLLDGNIINDDNPYNTNKKDIPQKITNKTYMSFKTALSLSFNNLLTKKGRTILTSLAGSIGIIGIALIMSLSNGVQKYIDKIEKETLSNYPLIIEKESVDTSSAITVLMNNKETKKEHKDGYVYSNSVMTELFNGMTNQVQTNNLKKFKNYLEKENKIDDLTQTIEYGYNIDLQIYNNSKDMIKVNPTDIFDKIGMSGMNYNKVYSNYNVFEKLYSKEEVLKSQYDLVKGSWPKEYNELVLIADKNNEISDYTLYALGLKNQDELKDSFNNLMKGKEIKIEDVSYSYKEILNMTFKLVLNSDYYVKNNNMWIDKSTDEGYLKELIDNGLELKIVGIIRPNDDSTVKQTNGSIGYLDSLNKYVIDNNNKSKIAKEQINNKSINIFTNTEFNNNEDMYKNLSQEQKMYLSTLSQEELMELMDTYTENSKSTYDDNLKKIGVASLDNPSSIYIYPKNFDSKEKIIDLIDEYNSEMKEQNKDDNIINYTDIVGMLMKSVTKIVNIISYVLIAFVAISLVVSSIMIGIITYISVLERVKEIGILRAIGASKNDISRVFNAETFIEGLSSGVLGILITLILNIPINIIIKNLTGIYGITKLPLNGAILLIIVSMVLTMIAGLIPSKMASKKDPVEALRTE